MDSILNQTFTDFELILVDDGSPDNCGKICDEYAQKDERVRAIHKENGGVGSARNLGIDEAKGEYISFIDPDDWIEQDMYSEILYNMKNNNLDILCTDVCEVRKSKSFVRHKFDENLIFIAEDALKKILIDDIDNSSCNKVYKKMFGKVYVSLLAGGLRMLLLFIKHFITLAK